VAIEHGEHDTVEVFQVAIAADGPRLTWIGCVDAPAPYFLNDIAALPQGAFAATHMFDRAAAARDPKAQQARLLAGEPTGYAVRWSAAEGWAKVPNTDGSFPNGMDASADGRTLYYAETYGHRVSAIGLDGSGKRSIAVAMQPDNVTVAADGAVIVAGGTGAPITSTAGCAAFRPQGCGFPSALLRLDFAVGAATPLFSDDGTKMSGASVGVVAGGRLYVGTSFGDRITVIPVP
jgi:sugar lactone lactonase YvrE